MDLRTLDWLNNAERLSLLDRDTNHVLLTGGAVRTTDGLSADSFVRSMTIQRLSADALGALSETVIMLVKAEGMEARAESISQGCEQ